ncbi:MAG: hypothetical protein U0934_11570 [Pseudotabrizicola sp.]|uniref:hypothetical protein n=1 Tax=Pseudotabrizicola sp. TaxID=2939647 RepID=UPI00271736EB|nr:hypothetical protein [Pseudotabrizicola sp.]MDO8883825.1 hypothetical protein [Pseudotabrizicola sp.]MDP2079659.1 hypothetical protein [Pseudotabrizicola sp.]MDZ7574578.1 hypothetical protein [Pseudotabrizicola sp.]
MLVGNASTTKAGLDIAMQLSPLGLLFYGFHEVRAQMLVQTGDYQSAACWGTGPRVHHAHCLITMIALAANSLAGNHDQAAQWRREVRRRKAAATTAHYTAAFPTKDTALRSLIMAELRRHGF